MRIVADWCISYCESSIEVVIKYFIVNIIHEILSLLSCLLL
jgi:hypothetical protein